ncbi:hypothetical protein NG54_15465, partial [Heyndrickxia ginsengihumi]
RGNIKYFEVNKFIENETKSYRTTNISTMVSQKTNFVTIDIRINNHYQYLNKGGNIKNYAASTYMSYDN